MKIKDLPKWLQLIAEVRLKEYRNIHKGDTVMGFCWHTTPEGHKFWGNIHDGIIPDSSDYVKEGDWGWLAHQGHFIKVHPPTTMETLIGPKFKVGDKVRMSEVGKRLYPDGCNNPHHQVGTVSKIYNDHSLVVQWTDATNGYAVCCCKLQKPQKLKKPVKQVVLLNSNAEPKNM